MASKVDICNRALIRLGAKTIVSLTEDSKEARLCNILYEQLRKDILRGHPWNFAMKRATITANADVFPEFDYAYYLPLPADCLRVWAVSGTGLPFKIEQRNLVADFESADVIYMANITDTEMFDSLFTSIFALRLAVELGYNLTGSGSVVQLLHTEYMQLKREAKLFDAQEGILESFDYGSWLYNRY
jgi:hypothetical protein